MPYQQAQHLVACEARILELRATLWEVRRLIAVGAGPHEVMARITRELETVEMELIDGERSSVVPAVATGNVARYWHSRKRRGRTS